MKSDFIKGTIILIIGGFITKILGMFIKIVLTRTIGIEGIGVYSLILPTFNLFITLCSLGLPVAISKLISQGEGNNKKIVLLSGLFLFVFDLLLILLLIVIAPYLSKYLLKNSLTYFPIIAIGFTLPFISLSSVLKGYFFGRSKMGVIIISNIIEQLMRLVLTITLIKYLMGYSLGVAIVGVVGINILSEGISSLTLIFFMPKRKININDFKYDKCILKEMFSISIPTMGSRLIGSISYFFEPVILTYVLMKIGYNSIFITNEYGIINGYVYPLLFLPSFFTMAISNSILPVISKYFHKKDYKYTKYKIKQALLLSLLIGLFFTFIFIFFSEYLLKFIYNTRSGINYIKVLAPLFLVYYIQGVLTSCMQAMNMAKTAMMGTFKGTLLKLIFLYLLSYKLPGMWGLIVASLINIYYVTIHHFYYVIRTINNK